MIGETGLQTPKISNRTKDKLNNTYQPIKSNNIHSPSKNIETAVMDSGASDSYHMPSQTKCLTKIKSAPNIRIKLPDSSIVNSNTKGELPISKQFTNKARTTRIVPKLTSTSVISTGNVCDDKSTAIFNSGKVYVAKNNELIMEGFQNQTTRL